MNKPQVKIEKALDVSEYLIVLGDREQRHVSNMSLQKILYFLQGIHIAHFDTPLFNEKIYAWSYGPVVKDMYHIYKMYGNDSIYPLNAGEKNFYFSLSVMRHNGNPDNLKNKDFIFDVWNVFKNYTPSQLVELTHAYDSPWYDIHLKYDGNIPRDEEITTDQLKKYFTDFIS